MTGGEILFFIFVLGPAAVGYIVIMFKIFDIAWNIKDYFKTRKEYMQKVIDEREQSTMD